MADCRQKSCSFQSSNFEISLHPPIWPIIDKKAVDSRVPTLRLVYISLNMADCRQKSCRFQSHNFEVSLHHPIWPIVDKKAVVSRVPTLRLVYIPPIWSLTKKGEKNTCQVFFQKLHFKPNFIEIDDPCFDKSWNPVHLVYRVICA